LALFIKPLAPDFSLFKNLFAFVLIPFNKALALRLIGLTIFSLTQLKPLLTVFFTFFQAFLIHPHF
jgi:hypothetical protein